MEVSKKMVVLFGGPCTRDPMILGSYAVFFGGGRGHYIFVLSRAQSTNLLLCACTYQPRYRLLK